MLTAAPRVRCVDIIDTLSPAPCLDTNFCDSIMCFASSRQTQTAMESPYQTDGNNRDLANRDIWISTKPHLDIEGKVFKCLV